MVAVVAVVAVVARPVVRRHGKSQEHLKINIAPCMQDGRFQTLEEVIKHYNEGIHRTSTLDPNLAKHPKGGIALSGKDQAALISFLKSLTDKKYGAKDPPKKTQAPLRR